MDGVVGRASGREQADRGIDDRLFVDHAAERAIVVAIPADLRQPVNGGAGQLLPKLGAGIDEGGAGNMQPHHLHHHLVRVGGAVEGAGAGAMIGGGLGLEQFGAADLALGIKLADALLLLVGEARGHRSRRHEDRRQMTEAQGADQQAGHDLVADAEQRRGLEHAVAEGDGGRKRDGVAAEQRELHAALALGHAVAHRRHPARDLRRRPDLAREQLDLLGVAAIGLMRREHVVVGGDDADIHRPAVADRELVLAGSGKAMREVSAGQGRAVDARVALARDQIEIGLARGARSFGDALRDRLDVGVKSHVALQ